MSELKELVTEELKKISEQVVGKQQEFQARLLSVEQQQARRGSGGGDLVGGSGGAYQATLTKCAEDLIAGMKGATSTRLELPDMSIKVLGISTDAPGALGSALYPVPPESLGPVSTYHPLVERLSNLLPSRPVTSNKVTYVRVHYATDSPPDGNMATKVAEGALKPKSSVVTDGVTVDISTYAHFADFSKQVLDDVPELQGILDGILRGGLLDVVDADIYNTLTTSGNYTTFTPVTGEPFGDSVARIAAKIVNLGGQNVIVGLSPIDYLSMQLKKATGSGEYLGIPSTLAARVVSVAAIASNKILAFAPGSGVSWADRQGVTFQLGYKNDDFVRNTVTGLVESRGAALPRDAAHVWYGNATA